MGFTTGSVKSSILFTCTRLGRLHLERRKVAVLGGGRCTESGYHTHSPRVTQYVSARLRNYQVLRSIEASQSFLFDTLRRR